MGDRCASVLALSPQVENWVQSQTTWRDKSQERCDRSTERPFWIRTEHPPAWRQQLYWLLFSEDSVWHFWSVLFYFKSICDICSGINCAFFFLQVFSLAHMSEKAVLWQMHSEVCLTSRLCWNSLNSKPHWSVRWGQQCVVYWPKAGCKWQSAKKSYQFQIILNHHPQ